MTLREKAIQTAMCQLGKPYIWGGNGVLGFDCSGLVQECLASVGLDPKGDQRAVDLWTIMSKQRVQAPDIGCLAFYGSNGIITHIAICLDSESVVEAGGGGRECTSPEAAEKVGAMVRIRPIRARKDLVGFVDPFHD